MQIAEFKGQNGKLIVKDDCILLSRKTFGGFVAQGGFAGDRIIFYKDISGVDYKKPTIWANGYYKFIVTGTTDTNASVGLLGSSLKSMKDENTIVLRAFSKSIGDETDRIYGIIMDKVKKAKSTESLSNNINPLEQIEKLAKLKEQGILSDSEFETQKAKLLNKL